MYIDTNSAIAKSLDWNIGHGSWITECRSVQEFGCVYYIWKRFLFSLEHFIQTKWYLFFFGCFFESKEKNNWTATIIINDKLNKLNRIQVNIKSYTLYLIEYENTIQRIRIFDIFSYYDWTLELNSVLRPFKTAYCIENDKCNQRNYWFYYLFITHTHNARIISNDSLLISTQNENIMRIVIVFKCQPFEVSFGLRTFPLIWMLTFKLCQRIKWAVSLNKLFQLNTNEIAINVGTDEMRWRKRKMTKKIWRIRRVRRKRRIQNNNEMSKIVAAIHVILFVRHGVLLYGWWSSCRPGLYIRRPVIFCKKRINGWIKHF